MAEIQITGGFLRSRKITFSQSKNLRPTLSKTRESVFNVLMNLRQFEDSTFLDMFAGSGIMSFEAISRGFQQVTCFDCDKNSINEIKLNAKNLAVENIAAYVARVPNVLYKLQKNNEQFSVIYIDPPYYAQLYTDTLKHIVASNVLAQNGIVVVEYPQDVYVDLSGFELLKQKVYSNKNVAFLTK